MVSDQRFEKHIEVASFVGKNAKGNPHTLVVNPEIAVSGEQISKSDPSRIWVLLSIDNRAFKARFFQAGREVQRCGSGSLACAYFLDKHNILGNAARLVGRFHDVFIGKTGQAYFYETSVLPNKVCKQKALYSGFVNTNPDDVLFVGGRSDYAVLLLKNESDVEKCKIHSPKIRRFTKRALIVTAQSERSGVDYVMRYFAPQYSSKEDAATGSANAMLANYWQQRLQKTNVTVEQLSSSGGLIKVKRMGRRQRVIGMVKALF